MSVGVRKNVFVAMAHDCLLDWVVRSPPPAQTSFNVLLFLGNFVLPRMGAVVPGREWREQPDPCVIMLDIARTHDGVALASLGAAGVVVLLSPPYIPDFNPLEDVFSVGSSWLRRYSGRKSTMRGRCCPLLACWSTSLEPCAAGLSRQPCVGTISISRYHNTDGAHVKASGKREP